MSDRPYVNEVLEHAARAVGRWDEQKRPFTRLNVVSMLRSLSLLASAASPEAADPRLAEALRFDKPWPVTELLRRLADAANHLLDVHDCDAHGWEDVRIAAGIARAVAADVERLRAGAAPPSSGTWLASIRASYGVEVFYVANAGWASTGLGYREGIGPYYSLPEALRRIEADRGESMWRPHRLEQQIGAGAAPPDATGKGWGLK